VLLDGGLSLLPTAGVAERHEYQALRTGAPNESFLLGGPLCYEGDVFSLAARLPGDIRAGDRVVIGDAGAYGVTRATSFNRPRAAVVSVSGDVAELCWRQENDEDIFRFQVTKPGGS
jgi:diaminopimelate decarboxylase